jgi:hypothetical protein
MNWENNEAGHDYVNNHADEEGIEEANGDGAAEAVWVDDAHQDLDVSDNGGVVAIGYAAGCRNRIRLPHFSQQLHSAAECQSCSHYQ